MKFFIALFSFFLLIFPLSGATQKVKVSLEVQDETPNEKFSAKIQTWIREALEMAGFEVTEKNAHYLLKAKLTKAEEGTINNVPVSEVIFSLQVLETKKTGEPSEVLNYHFSRKVFGVLEEVIYNVVKEVTKESMVNLRYPQNPKKRIPKIPPNIRGIPV